MARIFNIYFSYDDTLHSAIVSVRTTPFFTEYVLGNLDSDVRLQLPGTRIVSPSPGRLLFFDAPPDSPTALMDAILESLARHLQAGNRSEV